MNDEYSDYLQSDAWRQRRMKRLAISKFRCSACSCATAVHVHHLTYERIFDEDTSDLLPLCEIHHKAAEELIRKGELQRSGDVLFLASETIRLILGEKPVKSSKSPPAKNVSGARNPHQSMLLSDSAFVRMLRLTPRREFKIQFNKWARNHPNKAFRKNRMIANGFTLYDNRKNRKLL